MEAAQLGAPALPPPIERRMLLLSTCEPRAHPSQSALLHVDPAPLRADLLYILVNTISVPLMPSIKTELGFTGGTAATIAASQTAAQMCGKLAWGGWPVDALGGTRTYSGTMLTMGVLALCYSLAGSALAIGLLVFAMEFFSTSVYACHVQIVRGHWAEPVRADGFWLLGVASRSGDVLSKVTYGMLVQPAGPLPWRRVTFVGFGFACGAAIVALLWHRDTPSERFVRQREPLTPAKTARIVRRFFGMRMFWIASAAVATTTMVKRTNELLIPMYFQRIGMESGLVDDARAGQLGAAWSAGVAASVFVGGHFFAKAGAVPGRQSKLMAALLAVSTLSMALLALLPAHVETEAGLNVRIALVFTGGTVRAPSLQILSVG